MEKEGVGRMVHEGTKASLAPSQLLFGSLALTQIEHESNAFGLALVKRRGGEQNRDSSRRKDAPRQVVLEVEHTYELAPSDQRRTDDGPRRLAANVGVPRKRILDRSVLEDHGLSSVQDVVEDRLRQRYRSRRLI